jgi:hemerythrin-like domain-containing protein
MRSRREFIFAAGLGTASVIAVSPLGFIASSCGGKGEEVSANEDLMREHGVLRRALLVYALSAPRLRADSDTVSPSALNRTALLFRRFGEDYHERRLEEPFIFPEVKRNNPQLAEYTDILLVQHQRGREVTDYILSQTGGGKFSDARALADALDSFVLMYQEHTAREDTIIFPAWHKALSQHAYDEMGDKFEDIERQQFGGDGFDDAVKQIGEIEQELKVADLAQFTAAAPPKA